MGKLKIKPQAESCQWHESPLGVFHMLITAKDKETARQFRKYLPLIQTALLLGVGEDQNEKDMNDKEQH